MKVYIPHTANISKENNHYVIELPIQTEGLHEIIPDSRAFVLGKEIAPSNALALYRIIKKTTVYSATIRMYTSKIGASPDKIIIEIKAKSFPKLSLYVPTGKIEVTYSQRLIKNTKLLDAYIPTKKYINTKNKKQKQGVKNDRNSRSTRARGVQKR